MTTHPKPARVDLGDGDSLILFRTSDHHTTVRFHSANANTQLAGAVMETGALRAALDEVAPLGKYTRTTPDPDDMDGGVAAALIEKEAEQHDAAEVPELRSVLAREVARGNALQDALDAAGPRPLTPDAITDEMVKRGVEKFRTLPTGMSAHARVSVILTAALTEPPARPEGAEEIDEPLRQANAAALGGALTPEQRRALADHLAAMHIRVAHEEDPR